MLWLLWWLACLASSSCLRASYSVLFPLSRSSRTFPIKFSSTWWAVFAVIFLLLFLNVYQVGLTSLLCSYYTNRDANVPKYCGVSFAIGKLHQAYGHVMLPMSTWPKYARRPTVSTETEEPTTYQRPVAVFGHVLIGNITWPYAWRSSPMANETSQFVGTFASLVV